MICFLVIFAILIIQVCNSPETNSTIPNPNHHEILNYKRFIRSDICYKEKSCKLVCSHESDVNLEAEINKGLQLLDTPCSVELEIEGLQLPQNRIPENWLSNIATEIKILTIKSSPKLLEIANGSFSSPHLKRISTLNIRSCGVKKFYKDMFKDLSALTMFWLEYGWNSLTEIEVEDNFLTHVDSLTSLQFTSCELSSDTLRRITNSINLSKLVKLDLGDNKVRELEANVFDKARNLEALYLRNNNLKSLDVKVFERLSRLNVISLEGNDLTTLPEGIFDDISIKSDTSISLKGNKFDCNCDLKWLQTMYLENPDIFKDSPPECAEGSFTDSDFCPNGEVSPTTDISTTTTISNNLRTINCIKSLSIDVNIPKDLVDFQSITVEYEHVFNFTFYETTNSPLLIVIDITTTSDLNDFSLLWFNTYNPNEAECISSLENTISLDKMGQNKTYTICVLNKTKTTVSPFNCFGFKVRVEYSERAWIKNKSKITIIGVSIGIVLVCILISTCLMYWCVRFYPNLIKGNNRVIIIGKEKPKPQGGLAEYERPTYTAPSFVSYGSAQPSYITTTHYSKITNRNNRNPLGDIREESVYNGEVSYIKPSNSLVQDNISKWRDNVANVKVTEENNLYEPIPPPLPPPNQKQTKFLPGINLYSTA
ncbi:uncharacterized protein [Onthophagus taurus]|uniref:uncharacterized protein n=1 Tax=Onthophagus taurus TaxID=166361 RepID=UPI0039BE0529